MANVTTGAVTQALAQMGIRDYIALANRRKFWIIFPAVAVIIAVAVTAWRLPNIYRSDTIILVEPQKVPPNYFQATATGAWNERLASIYQQVVSPTRLKRLIDSLNLYPDIRSQEGEQEAIAVMQKAISVEQVAAMGSQGSQQAAAFRISFKGKNPAQTAQVTNQIAAIFIEENLKMREEQSYGTADFIDSELQKTGQELQAKSNELAELRTRYGQDLPEAAQFRFQEVEALRRQLETVEQQITQDKQQKVDLQSIGASTPPTVDLDLAAGTAGGDSDVEDLQAKLNALRSRYGPSHPDVRKLQAQLDEAKAKQGDTATTKTEAPAARARVNPVIAATMEQLDQDIEKQTKLATQIKSEINVQLSKMGDAPAFSQRAAGVMRDYEALQARYRMLEDKKMSAETATAMESREKTERFVLLDSAPVPEKPSSPNRPLLIMGGIPLGILVGIGIGLGRELMDDSVRNEREAEQILGTSVLSGVPEILTPQQFWQHTLRLSGVAVITVLLAIGLGFEMAHLSVRFL